MRMKRCTAAILLMLSLGALVAGRLSAAVVDDGADTILLPSQGLDDELVTVKRPWKCCDHTFCNRKMPPGCRCMDAVVECDKACSRCAKSPSDPSKRICMDRYTGDPGPSCTNPGNGGVDADISALPAAAAASSKMTIVESEAARPWTCCDDTLCTFSFPPVCYCRDKVKKCGKTCKSCEKDDASSRHVCRDSYFGWPGPTCTKSVAAGGNMLPEKENGNGNADGVTNGPAIAGHDATEIVVVDGEEDASPWKCCDLSRCTKSSPPSCQCLDKVKKCGKACKNCEKAGGSDGAPSRFICWDIIGKIAPRCTKSVASGQEATEEASGWKCCDPFCAIKVPSSAPCPFHSGDLGNGVGDGAAVAATEGARGWKCCDFPKCTIVIDLDERCPYSGSDLGNGAGEDVTAGPGVAGQEAAATATVGQRPWRCCNRPLSIRSDPPTWRCLDDLDGGCWSTCKRCVQDIRDPDSHRCLDEHTGDPGPRCSSLLNSTRLLNETMLLNSTRLLNDTMLLNSTGHVSTEKSAADADEQARPWTCCDDTLCNRSAPPTCQCLDKVKKCAKACKVCNKARESSGASPRYVCDDRYFGWPGDKCTKPVAADVRRGN